MDYDDEPDYEQMIAEDQWDGGGPPEPPSDDGDGYTGDFQPGNNEIPPAIRHKKSGQSDAYDDMSERS